jgi:Mlc titration factor MtfA (ptsG expression regulator)
MPPLHADMDRREWTRIFTAAWEQLQAALDRGDRTVVDPYAAESPAEFFAVVTESFFETPARLQAHWPAVYAQLRRYYRQDPLQRMRPCYPFSLGRRR